VRGENYGGRKVGGCFVWYTPTCVGKTYTNGAMGIDSTVHPHVRGENPLISFSDSLVIGTPPHAWGKQTQTAHRYANTAVHPHMRGEN